MLDMHIHITARSHKVCSEIWHENLALRKLDTFILHAYKTSLHIFSTVLYITLVQREALQARFIAFRRSFCVNNVKTVPFSILNLSFSLQHFSWYSDFIWVKNKALYHTWSRVWGYISLTYGRYAICSLVNVKIYDAFQYSNCFRRYSVCRSLLMNRHGFMNLTTHRDMHVFCHYNRKIKWE